MSPTRSVRSRGTLDNRPCDLSPIVNPCRLCGNPQQWADGAPAGVGRWKTNSNTALIALGYVNLIVAQFQAEQAAEIWPARAGAISQGSFSVVLQERPCSTKDFEGPLGSSFPGVIGTLTLIQVVSLTAFAVGSRTGSRDTGADHGEPRFVDRVHSGQGDAVLPHRPRRSRLNHDSRRALVSHSLHRQPTGHVAWRVAVSLLAAIGSACLLSTLALLSSRPFALNFFSGEPVLHSLRVRLSDRKPMPQVLSAMVHAINPVARYFLVVIRSSLPSRALYHRCFGRIWPAMGRLGARDVHPKCSALPEIPGLETFEGIPSLRVKSFGKLDGAVPLIIAGYGPARNCVGISDVGGDATRNGYAQKIRQYTGSVHMQSYVVIVGPVRAEHKRLMRRQRLESAVERGHQIALTSALRVTSWRQLKSTRCSGILPPAAVSDIAIAPDSTGRVRRSATSSLPLHWDEEDFATYDANPQLPLISKCRRCGLYPSLRTH